MRREKERATKVHSSIRNGKCVGWGLERDIRVMVRGMGRASGSERGREGKRGRKSQ